MRCKHLRDVDETYFGHMLFAWKTAWDLLKASVILVIHGVFPWWFDTYGSDVIEEQHASLQKKRSKIDELVATFLDCTSSDPEWLAEKKLSQSEKQDP